MTRYLDKAAKKCLQEEEEYHACPNAECSLGMERSFIIDCDRHVDQFLGAIYAKDDGNIFSCSMCKVRYCLVCEVPFHEGQTCAQYQARVLQQRTTDEQKSLDLVHEGSRPCPGCGANIHKFDGCDQMTCEILHLISFEQRTID